MGTGSGAAMRGRPTRCSDGRVGGSEDHGTMSACRPDRRRETTVARGFRRGDDSAVITTRRMEIDDDHYG